jgi:hypothetical protein
MLPLIKSRQPVTIEPCDTSLLEKGDIVYVRVKGRIYTHLIISVGNKEFQIGNNHGHSNGWTPEKNVFGIVTEIDGNPIQKAKSKVKKEVAK